MPVSPEIANMRAMFQTMFEGPDIWCDDKWATGQAAVLQKMATSIVIMGLCHEVDIYFPIYAENILGWKVRA